MRKVWHREVQCRHRRHRRRDDRLHARVIERLPVREYGAQRRLDLTLTGRGGPVQQAHILDIGAPAMRDAQAGPRIFTATSSLYGRLIWDHPVSSAAPSRPVLASAEMARRIVRSVGAARDRYNLTKTYTEITPDLLRAAVGESHAAGRRVMAHLGVVDARQAAEAGVDAIAHGSGIALATISDPARREELRTFARLGIAVDYPMFLLYHAYMHPAKAEELISVLVRENMRVEFEQVNTAGRWVPRYRDAWQEEDRRLLQNPGLGYVPQEVRDRIFYYQPWDQLTEVQKELVARGYENRREFIRRFVQAGGKVLAGCDAAFFVVPGLSACTARWNCWWMRA